MDLMGSRDIAEALAVTRQRVDQLTRDDPRFPTPVAIVGRRRVWDRADVEKWASLACRDLREEAAS